ncbi:phosphomevalonate kinase [Fructilactobacillus fructivorans]|uniref:phosphomevalonate kinase n=1 Tax=Fructilactobacillus fructivorans TaxID=1614 RepID=UPI0007051CDD|nr:phosphomevalonate kinase [Fructilactobacillus fructivorans]KRN43492.1 phosphomevalonate kinase [Fructilactobacillus fructivorans]
MISAKAPGKLYIAGEYAVVETGHPAIIAACDRFVRVSIKESSDFGSIYSKQYDENMLHWKRLGHRMVFDNRDNPFQYIISAIKVTEEYVETLNKNLKTYDIIVNSELNSSDGRKYGLGSSAAVTVATVKALCEFYDIDLTTMQLFKLAAIAHFEVQGNGSLGDVAASVFGGWIAYHSFDRQWLANARQDVDLVELINLKWPNLKIIPLTAPSNLQLLIGWSGCPTSTSNLVDRVELKKVRNSELYTDFLRLSKECVLKIVKGFKSSDLKMIQKNIEINRTLLLKLGEFANVEIETPKLKELIDIADHFGGAAKTSGAGGGDCGIVIIDKDDNIEDLIRDWNKHGIKLLDLKIHNN